MMISACDGQVAIFSILLDMCDNVFCQMTFKTKTSHPSRPLWATLCLTFAVTLLITIVAPADGIQQQLPVNNCLTDNVDLLVIEDTSKVKDNREMYYDKYLAILDSFFREDETTSDTRIRIAIATFSDNVTVHMDFKDDYGDYDAPAVSISEQISEFKPGEANTSAALEFIAERAFTPQFGSRLNAQHVAVLIVRRLPSVDVELAKELTARLRSQPDLYVVLIHSIKNLDQHSGILPTDITIQAPDIWKFRHQYIRPLCKPCQNGWFPVQETEGQTSCYKLQLRKDYCDYGKLPEMETKAEMLALEKEIFSLAQGLVQHDEDISVKIGLHHKENTFSKRFAWKNGRPLTYDNRYNRSTYGNLDNACTIWYFPKLNPTLEGLDITSRSQGATNESMEENVSILNKVDVIPRPGERNTLTYDSWRTIYNPGFQDVHCEQTVRRAICMSIHTTVYSKGIQHLSVSVPSLDKVSQAMDKGQYVYVDDKNLSGEGNVSLKGKAKIASLSKILPSVLKGDLDSRLGLDMSDLSRVLTKDTLGAIPLFDCRADSGEEFLAYSQVCDWRVDCSTGRDETICGDTGYKPCEQKCASGQCIARDAWCDLYPDCFDGSDEANCQDVCKHFRCYSGQCIPNNLQNDGYMDCDVDCNSASTDISLDESREAPQLGSCVAMCNRVMCLTREMILDDKTDCTGPEGNLDDILKQLPDTYCFSREPRVTGVENTWAPRCVYIKDRYGTVIGCTDFGHLENCESFVCHEGYFKCESSYCIPLHYLRNQVEDCPYGEDEDIREVVVNSNFECVPVSTDTPAIVLHPSLVCNGHSDCPTGDDEIDCGAGCGEGFLCAGGAVVVDVSATNVSVDLNSLDRNTKYLDLSGLSLPTLFYSFPGQGGSLPQVLWLNVSNCQIEKLDIPMIHFGVGATLGDYGEEEGSAVTSFAYASDDFHLVMVLDLSHNHLVSLTANSDWWKEDNAFRPMTNLQHLNLSHNPDLVISKLGFAKSASHIVSLDLSFTAVSDLSRDIMDMFTSLTSLSLEGTKISRLSPVFPTTLRVLNLQSIPLETIDSHPFHGLTRMQELLAPSYKACCPQIRGPSVPGHVCFAKSDVVSSCDDIIQEPIQRVLLWVFGTASLLGNVLVLIYRTTWDRALLKKGYGIFVLNLSSSDLLMGVYLLMIAYADMTYRGTYVLHDEDWRHSTMCHLAGFLSTWSCESSAMFIFLITLDRFLVIRFPFGVSGVSLVGYLLTSALAWACGLVLAVIPLLPRFRHWSLYSSNGMCLGLPLTADKAPGWEYSTSVFVGVNFILFLLIALGQIAIFRTMSSGRMAADDAMSKFQAMRLEKDMAVAKQLSLVVISDFLCWFPIGTLGLMALMGYDIGTDMYGWFAVLVLPINSAINPLLYTVPALKKTFGNLFVKLINRASAKMASKEKSVDAVVRGLNNSSRFTEQLMTFITTLKLAKGFLANKDMSASQIEAFQNKSEDLKRELDEVSTIVVSLTSKQSDEPVEE